MRCINSSTLGSSSVLGSAMAFSLVLYCNAATACRAAPHDLPTLPIIGSVRAKWNVFSIFICREIFIATPWKMT
jgi:hypothetical protein